MYPYGGILQNFYEPQDVAEEVMKPIQFKWNWHLIFISASVPSLELRDTKKNWEIDRFYIYLATLSLERIQILLGKVLKKWHMYLLIVWSCLFISCSCSLWSMKHLNSWCLMDNCVRHPLVLDPLLNGSADEHISSWATHLDCDRCLVYSCLHTPRLCTSTHRHSVILLSNWKIGKRARERKGKTRWL